MSPLLQALGRLFPDPPPQLVFEIGAGAVLGARRSGRRVLARAERGLEAPATDAAPGDPPSGLAEAVADILDEIGPAPSQHVAVLLPDDSTRLALFDFDQLPGKASDLRSSVERRFRNRLPFDARSARIAYRLQGDAGSPSVLATAAPAPYIRNCERAFERSGLLPGFVGAASASALNLLVDDGTSVLLKLAEGSMTLAAVEDRTVRLVRSVSLPATREVGTEAALGEILADLFPTLAFIEESLGASVSCLRLAGRGVLFQAALDALPRELACPVLPVGEGDPEGTTCDAGLLGYIHA